MDEIKQVKVDNWGTFFLQRLKHFFNRTDYCDLTLQFQDKAQLKVHRLVLSACTEYFELLERTCEMYEDCLVMPDDLQADVVVPIINFMYTGHLEFSMDILEKLYQTSLVMNMPVLTTLLESHRNPVNTIKPPFNRNFTKHYKPRSNVATSLNAQSPNARSNKRPYTVAFEKSNLDLQTNKVVIPSPQNPIPPLNMNRVKMLVNKDPVSKTISINKFGMSPYYNKRLVRGEPKPTRCELPEELENDDNTFTNSFMNISYESKPLVVHPETKAQEKKSNIFNKAKISSKNSSSADILECKKISRSCSLFDENPDIADDYEIPQATLTNIHNAPRKSAGQLFDQIVENEENDSFNKPKVTIETSDCKQSANLDHAKIISEVLKKYPHLVNSNKNIKLKVLNTNNKTSPKISPPQGKQKNISQIANSGEDKIDYIDRDILDTKEAARLIALGITNVGGPWICLMCGTPSKALRFGSYYYYRRHLVEVHNEKPATRMCEYCGLKTPKRNLLIHHLLTKHGVDPPIQYNFPRCNICNYIGLTEANLAKHKMNHNLSTDIYKCNVCYKKFASTNQLLAHIQQTGHKFTGERKADLKCIYCLRVFIRKGNLYSHIKANHKNNAIRDGVIDDSEDEKEKEEIIIKKEGQSVKHEAYSSDYEEDGQTQDMQYIPHKLFRKNPAQKILNSGFPSQKYQSKTVSNPGTVQIINKQQNLIQEEYTTSSVEDEDMVDIDGEEYFVHNNQLVKYISSAKRRNNKEEYLLPDMASSQEYIIQQHDVTNETQYIEQLPTLKKLPNSHQPVQIVVANDEEYDTLMSSNTTAIFDENTSKTLTVLTTPDTANLVQTGIDIPGTVSNSMMIIPDDYPLSVTTSGTPIDSNIMVVYTQPTEMTNTSYQIITTGNGEQYVQTSDVANDVETLSVTAIPNDDIGSQQENPTKIEGTSVETVIANTVSNEVVIEKEINDNLPEVTMSGPLATQTLEVVQDNIEMSQTFTQDETELQDSQEDSNVIHDNEHIEKATIVEQEESTAHNVEKENNSADNSHVEHSDSVMEVFENNQIIAYQTDVNETDNVAVVIQNDDGLHKQEDVEMVEINKANEIVPEVVKEKIQTLTSEWSEDETEVVEQEINTENVTEIPQNHDANTEYVTEPEEELEESIENIQKVMNKDNIEKEVVLQNNTEETILENTGPIPKNIEDSGRPPQEKISSLLNDWEDNDTQEESNGDENGKPEAYDVSEEVQQEIEMEHEAPKDDKIKSLVSDWDDDEEEQKE